MTKWEQLQKKMQAILSKEIALRQELLAVMRQQEHGLLLGGPIVEEGDDTLHRLVEHLRKVTKLRAHVKRELLERLYSNHAEIQLNEALNPLVDIEAETLLLYKKTKALIDKIHGQHLRNKALYEMILKGGPLHVRNEGLLSKMAEIKEKKKISLITIDYYSREEPT